MIAGLAAEGITVVDDIYYIERGYEEFEKNSHHWGCDRESKHRERDTEVYTESVIAVENMAGKTVMQELLCRDYYVEAAKQELLCREYYVEAAMGGRFRVWETSFTMAFLLPEHS